MKKINYKKVAVAFAWVLALSGIVTSLAFVSKKEENIIVKSIAINIQNNDENPFVKEIDIQNYFNERNDSLINNRYKNISIPELEKALNAHPAIQDAQVAADLKGELKINLIQRTPTVRVVTTNGESYYIDTQSKLMPLNDNYTARVIIANGNIPEFYSQRSDYSINQYKEMRSFKDVSVLDDIYDVATFINQDSTLSSLIHQIHINADKELELYPAIGSHKIIFGSGTDIQEKFTRLKLFYQQGLNKTDNWNKYSTINLKFKNLVVCSKHATDKSKN